ncbi:response regulator [Nostoc sp. CHAB 5834]|nr:response regulator [Nostoc sp. CHAB 5834]
MKNNKFRIFVADDDDDDRLLIKTALEPYTDCKVTLFENGHSLLLGLIENFPDGLPTLVLLDLNMPGLNGYEVLSRIRSKPTLQAIPIIVLSGTDDEHAVRKAYTLGANSFMSKPHSVRDFNKLFRVTYEYWLKTARTPFNP